MGGIEVSQDVKKRKFYHLTQNTQDKPQSFAPHQSQNSGARFLWQQAGFRPALLLIPCLRTAFLLKK
jgi:hypothetical protein